MLEEFISHRFNLFSFILNSPQSVSTLSIAIFTKIIRFFLPRHCIIAIYSIYFIQRCLMRFIQKVVVLLRTVLLQLTLLAHFKDASVIYQFFYESIFKIKIVNMIIFKVIEKCKFFTVNYFQVIIAHLGFIKSIIL